MRPSERLQALRPRPEPPLRVPRFATACLCELGAFALFATFCVLLAALLRWGFGWPI